LAPPVINPIVLASTWAAFGSGSVFWGRIGIAVVVAALVGFLFILAPASQKVLRPAAQFSSAPASIGNAGRRTGVETPEEQRRMAEGKLRKEDWVRRRSARETRPPQC
jgi:uncharacterized membrane protein YraQ (UPF0718 family)